VITVLRARGPRASGLTIAPPLQALTALGCMEHRGACSADDDSGDGAGLMTQIPWKLLKQDMPSLNEATTG
jgi:glutamate synthase (ferredoxin)